jgi:hypothetical protein
MPQPDVQVKFNLAALKIQVRQYVIISDAAIAGDEA